LVLRNNLQGICPICSKEENWSHTFRYGETGNWWDGSMDNMFRNINAKVVKRLAECTDKEQ
jgi:hypothetical protein